jgi:hypothetical protein
VSKGLHSKDERFVKAVKPGLDQASVVAFDAAQIGGTEDSPSPLAALRSYQISHERIDQSMLRILKRSFKEAYLNFHTSNRQSGQYRGP